MSSAKRRFIVGSLACAVVSCGLVGVVRRTEARSIGCGPAVVHLSFYPNDTAIVEVQYTGSSADPEILGYYVEFAGVPEGMFVSLEEDAEVRYIEVPDPSCPRESSKRWPFPVYYGRMGSGVDLSSPVDLTFGGLWPPGLPIVVVAYNRVEMSYETPEIPRSSWTITNTSPYDIEDGVLHVPGLGRTMRYIPGLVIPAGGSLTVEGQMESGTKWAFGGMLDSPEPQPVFAFDAGGVSPEGMAFPDVFTADTDYPATGREAALTANGAIQHMGPRPGYVGSLEPYAASPTQFDLYSFSTGQRVGGGRQTPMLSPKAWDPGQTPAAPSGGTGVWDTVTGQWSDGAADGDWNNAANDDVAFGGSAGEVRIDEPISARSLAFHTSGYTLSGTASLTLSSGDVYVPAGNAAIGTSIAGSAGLAKTGDGTLSLSADNTYTGPTRVVGGTLAVGADAHFGDTSTPGEVILDKGATLRTTSSFTTRRRVMIGESGGTVDVAAGTLTLLGPEGDWGLGGTTGKLTKTGPGELKVKTGADPGRTGDVEIVAGTVSIFGGGLGSGVHLIIQPDGTFNAAEGHIGFRHVTINGGLLTFTRSGPDGGTDTGNVVFTRLSMTGGTINIGTAEQAGQVFFAGPVTVHPSDQTALIKSDSGEGMLLVRGAPLHPFHIADGDALIDMDIQVPLPINWIRKDGEGLLRTSGDRDNNTSGDMYTVVEAGTLELAKPDGVAAAKNLRLAGGELRLGNPNQIRDSGQMDLSGGTFNTHGLSELLGPLTLGADSAIDVGTGGTGVVAFADSRQADWNLTATLGILNWSGDPAGGAPQRLLFGSNAEGLSAGQLDRLRFVNPHGLLPGTYYAAILATGEVVPAVPTRWQREPGDAGDWESAANWARGVPTGELDVRIENGGTAELSGVAEARNLSIGVVAPGRLEVQGSGDVTTGELTIGLEGEMVSSGLVDARRIAVDGTARLSGGKAAASGTVDVGPGGSVVTSANALLEAEDIAVHGTLTVTGGRASARRAISVCAGGTTVVHPDGALEAGSATIDGTVDLAGGSAALGGTTWVGAGGRAVVAGDGRLDGHRIMVDGTLSVAGGQVALDSVIVRSGGTFELDGDNDCQVASLDNGGLLHAKAGSTDLGDTVIRGLIAELPTEGLGAHYSLDDPDSFGHDDVGEDHRGDPAGESLRLAVGVVGGAMATNGHNGIIGLDGGGTVANDFYHDGTTARSWAGWLRQKDNRGSQLVFEEGAGDCGIMVFVDHGVLKMHMGNYAGQWIDLVGGPLDGGWHHVAVTLGAYTCALWVDGNQVGSEPFTDRDGHLRWHASQPGIGIEAGEAPMGTDSGFIGLLDEWYVYKTGLTEDDVPDLYNLGRLGHGTSGTFGDVTVEPGAVLAVGGIQETNRLVVRGTLALGSRPSDCAELLLDDSALVDLHAGGSLLVREGDLTAIAALLRDAHQAGWDVHEGITCRDLIGTDGAAVGVFSDPNGVLIKPTALGDADLSGSMDRDDFLALRDSFGRTDGVYWQDGDSNYDGEVGFLDYVAMKRSFAAAAPGGAVPEPATCLLLAVAGAGLLRRRRARASRP